MLFLIQYDRLRGKLVALESFDDSAHRVAENRRLDLELILNRQGIRYEVVILEAATEDDLRKTHRRYFEDLEDLSSAHSGST